jgi:hypothetical protein
MLAVVSGCCEYANLARLRKHPGAARSMTPIRLA